MFKLSVTNKNFPSHIGRLSNTLNFSRTKLLWATLTVGRDQKRTVTKHGAYSKFEMLYRWNMLQATLDFSGPTGYIYNSAAFTEFDPSEKGAINFFLGMVCTKLCAQELLDIPWLIHASLFEQVGGSTKLKSGRSCADLVGLSSSTGKWSVFEAKGRNSGYSSTLIRKAKDQAQNIVGVNNQVPDMYVAAIAYRRGTSKQLSFYWEDPPPDQRKPEIKLKATRETWEQYYYPVLRFLDNDSSDLNNALGLRVELRPELERFLQSLEDGKGFEKRREELFNWSTGRDRQDDFWNGDGVGLKIADEKRISQ